MLYMYWRVDGLVGVMIQCLNMNIGLRLGVTQKDMEETQVILLMYTWVRLMILVGATPTTICSHTAPCTAGGALRDALLITR